MKRFIPIVLTLSLMGSLLLSASDLPEQADQEMQIRLKVAEEISKLEMPQTISPVETPKLNLYEILEKNYDDGLNSLRWLALSQALAIAIIAGILVGSFAYLIKL